MGELEADLERTTTGLADLAKQLGSAQASMAGLPDHRELHWMLDRREELDAQLRSAASTRVRGFRLEPPPYLINALGSELGSRRMQRASSALRDEIQRTMEDLQRHREQHRWRGLVR